MRNSALNRVYDFKNREDQGQLLENYVYRRLTKLYDKDNIKFWRTTDKKEIDFVVTTSFNKGLAYEVKMNSRNLNSGSKRIVLERRQNPYVSGEVPMCQKSDKAFHFSF